MDMRREHDLLGDRAVPAAAYYGVHTLRAVENFPITGTPISIYPDLIVALAAIRSGSARISKVVTSSASPPHRIVNVPNPPINKVPP